MFLIAIPLIALSNSAVVQNINIGKYIVANIIGGIVLVYLVGTIYLSYITKMPIDKAKELMENRKNKMEIAFL